MTEPPYPADQPAKVQPVDEDLGFSGGDLSDLDPDVVQGMMRLKALRDNESTISEI